MSYTDYTDPTPTTSSMYPGARFLLDDVAPAIQTTDFRSSTKSSWALRKEVTSEYIATFETSHRRLEALDSLIRLPLRASSLAPLGLEEWTRYFRPQERIEAKEEAPVQPEALYSWFIGVSFSWHNHKLLPLSCRIFEFWLQKSRVSISILEITLNSTAN